MRVLFFDKDQIIDEESLNRRQVFQEQGIIGSFDEDFVALLYNGRQVSCESACYCQRDKDGRLGYGERENGQDLVCVLVCFYGQGRF